ncbi:saccharopine dehydrogenase NADP-binding domain-containing protein [Sporosarcina sp. Sa2YVA2]|uniref:Saccharopine dehydrogenase NADP-binding domain-containing protein n=1 Tax=Sporosarcina quadrami TaxID=2762234 RepID=A0ABR8U942_9BACL|nr:saccharopine dehydrogenase C-terminal domain-containing protein [Sporosarcina quadrami]MBD7984546.1 saccharopine dehydrogenase NADP-binding domain-containing protein [Sporosarcina quadrami]
MHVTVLGTGMIGRTVVREIVNFPLITKVTVVDMNENNIDDCVASVNNPKLEGRVSSLETEETIVRLLTGADLAIACLPHSLSMTVVKAAIKAKCHLVDLVGSMYNEKMTFDEAAKEAGVIIVPGCGVSPGITNFLAAQGIHMLDEAEEAVMICGGNPRYPVEPLNYQVVFRPESLFGLYTKPSLTVQNGQLVEMLPFSGFEKMQFPAPFGDCESVITDGHSTVYTLKDKVSNLYEKTVRYPGHWGKMMMLSELGFFDNAPVDVNGVPTSPRKVTETLLERKMKGTSNEDITALRVIVSGFKDDEHVTYTWEMLDFYDNERNITSMAKTTALPAAITAKWILARKFDKVGILPLERLIIGEHFLPFVQDLKEAGIDITFKESVGMSSL